MTGPARPQARHRALPGLALAGFALGARAAESSWLATAPLE